MRRLLITAITLICASTLWAQESRPLRPVTQAWTVQAGSSHLTDSYLSPLHYSGQSYALAYERFQAMRFDPQRWIMRLEGTLSFDDTRNPARNARMRAAELAVSWGMMRRWQLPYNFTLSLGGSTGITAGANVLSRNSNNPATAKAAWTVNLTGMAQWRTRLLGRDMVLRYQPTLPLLGCFFGQQYGELYYEMYLGDTSGLVHFAWPGSRAAMDNLLTADWRLGATALRLGYSATLLTSKAAGVVNRRFTHRFILGISLESISLNPNNRHDRATAEIISAYY